MHLPSLECDDTKAADIKLSLETLEAEISSRGVSIVVDPKDKCAIYE
jgi:hypothetical protein